MISRLQRAFVQVVVFGVAAGSLAGCGSGKVTMCEGSSGTSNDITGTIRE